MSTVMKPVQEAFGKTLQWTQPKTSERTFEMHAGDDVFARLVFQSQWGSLAHGECLHGRWTFKRVGFFWPRVTVRKADSEEDLITFTPGWSGSEGRIEWVSGRRDDWKSANFWATQYAITTEQGDVLVLIKEGIKNAHLGDLFKVQAEIQLGGQSGNPTEIALLALLGWYLMVLNFEDTAAATVVVTA